MEYLNFLLAFLTQNLAELQALVLTDNYCFVDPSPMLTIIRVLLFPTQSLHETPYQLHLYLIIYLFWKVMYGCISHINISITICVFFADRHITFIQKKQQQQKKKRMNRSCEARQCCICLQQNAWSESNIVPTSLTTKRGKCYQAHNQVFEKGSYMGVWWHA